jgi:hypothetical protein
MDMSKMPTDGRKRETPQERAARLSNNSLDLALKADLNLCCQILRSIPKETVPDVKSLLLNRKKWFVTPEGKLDAETVTRLGGTIRGPLGQALDAEGQPLKMLVDGAIGESPPEGVMNFTPKKLEELKEKFIWKPEENWLSQPLLKKKEVFLNDLDADKISMVTSKIEPTSLSLANQGAMRQGSQRKPPREKNLELTEFTTMRDKYFRIDGFGCYLELISYLHELNLAQGRPAAELMLSAGQHNWIEKKSGWWGLLYVATEKKLYLWFKDTSYKALITEVPDAAAAELYTVQFPFSLMRGRVEKTDSSMNARLCFDYFPNDPSDPVRIQMARVPERLKPQTPPSSSTGVRRRQFRGSGGGASAAAAVLLLVQIIRWRDPGSAERARSPGPRTTLLWGSQAAMPTRCRWPSGTAKTAGRCRSSSRTRTARPRVGRVLAAGRRARTAARKSRRSRMIRPSRSRR